MTLRRKTLLIVSLTLAVLVVLLYLVLRTLLMGSFISLEQQVSLRDLNRAEINLHDQSASMKQVIRDWSTRDETYTFIQDASAHCFAFHIKEEIGDLFPAVEFSLQAIEVGSSIEFIA